MQEVYSRTNAQSVMSSPGTNSSPTSDATDQAGDVKKSKTASSALRSLHCQVLRKPIESAKFRQDHRYRLPNVVSRFIGYRPPKTEPPYDPLPFPPFSWLTKIPVKLEVWIFGWTGAFGGILLIEAIMSASTAFRDVYTAPVIITSFGASAVLLFGVIESPLAQPRNFMLGHFVSALVGVCITRLFDRNPRYQSELGNTAFHPSPFVNGGLSMATALLAQEMIGALHPPYAYLIPSLFLFTMLTNNQCWGYRFECGSGRCRGQNVLELPPCRSSFVSYHAWLGLYHQQPRSSSISYILVESLVQLDPWRRQ